MAHVNGSIPERYQVEQELTLAKKEAESQFWRETANEFMKELRNIPDAIEKYGYWTYTDKQGNTVKLVPEPKPRTNEK